MKKLLKDQHGVTLIETVVAIAIIAIIITTILGALLYGQKMIVFTDTKNNAASVGQEKIDELMASLSAGTNPVPKSETVTVKGYTVVVEINEVDKDNDAAKVKEGYDIRVQVYYNNNESYIELKSYVKKGGVFI